MDYVIEYSGFLVVLEAYANCIFDLDETKSTTSYVFTPEDGIVT